MQWQKSKNKKKNLKLYHDGTLYVVFKNPYGHGFTFSYRADGQMPTYAGLIFDTMDEARHTVEAMISLKLPA